MANYYLRYNDRVSGPFPIDTLKTMARDGLVTSAHSLSLDREQWFPADQIPGLFDPSSAILDEFTSRFATVPPEKESTGLTGNRGCGLAMLIGGVLVLFLAHAMSFDRMGLAYGMVIIGLILPGVYSLVTGKEPK